MLAKAFVTAGRAGGPFPTEVAPHLVDLWPIRDLSQANNRACYVGLAATVDSGIDGLPEALYERLLTADDWVPYADTVPTLRALRAAGVKIAVVSNIGFDIRPIVAGLGFADLIDAYALSYEVGACKPDPMIFNAACRMLGVAPTDTIMVGDTPADAGAAGVGCTCLIVPAQGPGEANGLRTVLDVAGVTVE